MKCRYMHFTEEEAFEWWQEQETVPRLGDKVVGMGHHVDEEPLTVLQVSDVMWFWDAHDEAATDFAYVVVELDVPEEILLERKLRGLPRPDNTTPFD